MSSRARCGSDAAAAQAASHAAPSGHPHSAATAPRLHPARAHAPGPLRLLRPRAAQARRRKQRAAGSGREGRARLACCADERSPLRIFYAPACAPHGWRRRRRRARSCACVPACTPGVRTHSLGTCEECSSRSRTTPDDDDGTSRWWHASCPAGPTRVRSRAQAMPQHSRHISRNGCSATRECGHELVAAPSAAKDMSCTFLGGGHAAQRGARDAILGHIHARRRLLPSCVAGQSGSHEGRGAPREAPIT